MGEHKNKRERGKDSKIPKGGRKNNKQSPKDKKKGKNKKKTKKNDNRKLSTRKEEKKTDSENEESAEKEASRQIATADADPDRYKHCDYLDLVEVGYREDSICKPGFRCPDWQRGTWKGKTEAEEKKTEKAE